MKIKYLETWQRRASTNIKSAAKNINNEKTATKHLIKANCKDTIQFMRV